MRKDCIEKIKTGIEVPTTRCGPLSELVSDKAVDEGFSDRDDVIVSVCEDGSRTGVSSDDGMTLLEGPIIGIEGDATTVCVAVDIV